jgi:hypothetical protein
MHQFNFPNSVCGKQPGNWYTVDCPAYGEKNSSDLLAKVTTFGCPSDIAVIDTSSVSTDIAKAALLLTTCTTNAATTGSPLSAKPGCLTANTGGLTQDKVVDAWGYLTGLKDDQRNTLATPVMPKSILLPVFLKNSVGVDKSGNNTVYPVYAFVGATVCGYHWNNKVGLSNLGDCVGAAFDATADDSIILVKANVLVSGSTGGVLCSLGDTCDLGARRVRLTE